MALRFDDVSDKFLSSKVDKSVVFTALLVVFYMGYRVIAHEDERDNW